MSISEAQPSRSRVIKAYDVRGVVPDDLDADLVRDVGAAFADLTRPPDGQAHPGVIVGRDARTSSPELAAAFAEGATGRGAPVVDIGLASTDMLYFAAGTLHLPGAMITASHNPGRYNGVKLCRAGAVPVGRDSGLAEIAAAVDAAPTDRLAPADGPAPVTQRDVLPDYVEYLHRLVPLGAGRALTVAVDAGNGMAGLTVPAVLADTPVTLDGLYLELDGTFPNHPADPLDSATLVDLQRRVLETGADLGLAFDGDADRCFVVDEAGALVDPSAITALIAVRELRRHPGASIIHNLITSRAVPEVVSEHGGVPVRTRVGHSFIKSRMAQTGAVFGGEHSGHFYFADFWRADSGMLAALHVLAALGETPPGTPLSELVGRYQRYARSGEVNSVVASPKAVITAVRATYGSRPGITLDDLDGLTVSGPGWWFNLRPSNTEPLLRLNVEARDPDTMGAVRDEVLAFVAAHRD
jgi:phosphomannomutase